MNKRGSMTVEASFILPLFLLAFVSFISLIQIVAAYGAVQMAVHQTAKEMALYGHALSKNVELNDEASTGVAPLIIGQIAARQMVANYLDGQLDASHIKGGSNGLFYLQSKFSENNIDLVVTYKVEPYFSLMGFNSFTLANRAKLKIWNGYDVSGESYEEETGEQIVYVTQTGSVYHTNKNCTHLRLSISATSAESVSALRNDSGGKYSACELCGKEGGLGGLFVASTGDRYHTNINCSGLKRTIYEILISQINGKPLCSRCASGGG